MLLLMKNIVFQNIFFHSNILFFDYDRLDKILNEISPVLYLLEKCDWKKLYVK